MMEELHQLKSDFSDMREQLDSYEMLLSERTLDGTMRFDDAMAKSGRPTASGVFPTSADAAGAGDVSEQSQGEGGHC